MSMPIEVNQRPRVFRANALRTLPGATPTREPAAFHARLPGYVPSPLLDAPEIARSLGLERLWVKDESSRLGLPAFKILGASWAVHRAAAAALNARTGAEVGEWRTIEDLARAFAPLRPMTLACATDGNHGRAVARMARLLGFSARIFVPVDMAPVRIDAIAGEGAEIVVFPGSYDEAVARSAQEAGDDCLVISDTSWPGYVDVPGWVIEGYSTIFWEIDDELARLGEPGPDLVAVQIGVGAFAAAAIRHYRRAGVDPQPVMLGVEPTKAACALASMEAGRIVELPPPHDSIMSGLNCGAPSPLAWPLLSEGLDAFIAVGDDDVRREMRALAGSGIVVGECGAGGLAGLRSWRGSCGGLSGRRALIISTEGATDRAAYDRIVNG